MKEYILFRELEGLKIPGLKYGHTSAQALRIASLSKVRRLSLYMRGVPDAL
jgi:hypothetical protein